LRDILRSLPQSTRGSNHLIGSRPHAHIFGKVLPADDTGTIDQELRGPRNVVAFGTTARVQQIIAADNIGLRIGKKSEGKSRLAPQVTRNIGGIYAYGHRYDALRLKLAQPFLNSSQLEDAEGSPVSAIKDQQYAFRRTASV
jgi:hypothetical protein